MTDSKVVVSRRWNSPEIEITIDNEKIEVKMKLSDFLEAVGTEFGNPATYMTVKGLKYGLTQASQKVITGMKKETARVM